METRIVTMDDPTPTLAALDLWPALDPAEVASGDPVQHGLAVHHEQGTGLSVGTWHCTPYVSPLIHYPVDEYMVILQGSVTIEHEDGHILTFRAGDGFFMPKGTKGVWRQYEPLLKHFVIYNDGKDPAAVHDPAQRAVRVDATTAPGRQFQSADGRFTVQLAQTDGTRATDGAADLFHHVLAGGVTADAAGQKAAAVAGESLFVPRGTPSRLTGEDAAVVTCALV